MTVAVELAEARRRLGLSVEELSRRTKIKVERLDAIEQMDVGRLPTLLYLKGFLRAYAAEVQLDPEQITERYLSELDIVAPSFAAPAITTVPIADSALAGFGRETHSDNDHVRGAEGRHVRPAEPDNVRVEKHNVRGAETKNLRVERDDPRRAERPAPVPLAVAGGGGDRAWDVRSIDAHDIRLRHDHDVWPRPHDMSSPRRSIWRYAAVVLVSAAGLLAGWMIGLNIDPIASRVVEAAVALRDAAEDATAAIDVADADAPRRVAPAVGEGSNTPDTAKAVVSESDPAPTAARSAPEAKPRGERAAAGADAASGAASTETPLKEPGAPVVDRPAMPTARGAGSTAEASATHVAESTPPVVDTPADRSRSGEATGSDARSREASNNDLSGNWALTNRVESSSYGPFNGMNVGFHLQLQQRGNRVTGSGEKWMENGRALPPGSRTPIRVQGTITDGRLQLSFTERGTERTSAGTLLLDVTEQGTLSGTFLSDAANSEGTSLARRMETPRR